ncbi:MAG: post-translocation molecular chaperone, partial [Chloroflexi bacterium]|nr:post-translocation molecular chaperone [Chloroflexota bacterium]
RLQEVLAARVPTTAEQIQARHILVADEQAARLVMSRLVGGEDFAALATELSLDEGSKENGGDLGWFPRGTMVAEFESMAFSLPVGAVSEPVQTQFGYHVIKVEAHEMDRPLNDEHLSAAQSAAMDNWLAERLQGVTVERFLSADKIPPTPSTPIG